MSRAIAGRGVRRGLGGVARTLARVPLAAPAGALVLACLLALAARSSSWAEPVPGTAGLLEGAGRADGEPIVVDANQVTYDKNNDRITAEGDVVITHGASVLSADRVELDRKSGEAEASGSVVLEDPQARVRAARAWLEIEDETGFLERGEVYLPQTRFQISGERLEKGVGQTYHIWDGTLTTCECEEGAPDWSVTGDEIDVSVRGFGTVRDGTFRIKDVPVLYLPYGIFPVRRDRQSGFLFPRLGFSNNRGFQWEQPFYWAIDKTQDATIALDVETSARLGLIGEYRYWLAPDAGGLLTGTYFNEHIRGSTADAIVDPETLADPTIPENRGSVIGYHQQTGPGNSSIYVRPFWVSDNLFLREMNTLSYLPTVGPFSTLRRYTTSRAGAVKVFPWGILQADATYYQDLIQKQSRVPQPLPRLTFQARQSVLDGHLRLALNTEAVEYWRAPLASGPRIDIAPEARVPYRVGPYGYGSLKLVLRETAYYLSSTDVPIVPYPLPSPSAPLETRTVPNLQHRETLQLSADLSSELARVYQVEAGELRKVKHTIEPYLRYNYVPKVQQGDLPLYDSVDRINGRNLVTYGLLTRLLGKFGAPAGLALETGPAAPSPGPSGEPAVPSRAPPPSVAPEVASRIQELGRAFIQQGYAITDPIFVTPGSSEKQNLSAIDAGLRLTPLPFVGAQGRTTFSIAEPRQLLYAEAGVSVFDPRAVAGEDDLFLPGLRPRNSASVFYQFNSGGTVKNINLAATFRVTDNLALAYLGRFDGLANRFLENWAGFRLISACDCWVVDVALVDRVNPDEREVRVLFSLVGLGSFGQQPFAGRSAGFGATQPTGPGLGGVY